MARHSAPLLGREMATPANPSSGARLLYPKTDGWYEKNSAGVETKLAGGSVVTSTPGSNVNTKVFRHVLVHRHAAGTTTGSLVISTPITFPAAGASGSMTRIHLTGYNYITNLSDIDAVVTFYAYTSTVPAPAFANTSFRSDGNRTMTCRLARDANNLVIIILDNPEGNWGWTNLHIPFVQIGHALPPDSFATGWTAAVTTDLTPYTVMNTPTARDNYTEITNLRARTITGTSGLTGGGDLTANRTISADFGTGNAQVARGDHSHTTAPLHKTTHATGGTDALTPGDIGAATSAHKTTHAIGGTDALTPGDIGAATSAHKTTHAIGGTDALTPADIGAAASGHAHGSDTGWLDPFSDPAGAWVKHGTEPLRIRKIDNRVTLVGIVQRGPTVTFLGNNTYERIHTLSATYQPVGRSIHGTLATQQSGVRMKFRLFRTGLTNAGDLEIANDGNDLSTNGNVYFNLTWLTD